MRQRQAFLKLDYTARDIRYTRNRANTVLYATALSWPRDTICLEAFAGVAPEATASVHLLDRKSPLAFDATDRGLVIHLGAKPAYDHAFPVRITFHGQIPNTRRTP